VIEYVVTSLRDHGWVVLRMMAQPSRFTEQQDFKIDTDHLEASAAGVAAIDTIWSNFKDTDGLLADSRAGRRAGFSGKMAIHPDQVDIINQAFTPDASEIAFAQRVVDAFAAAEGAGALQLDGKMLDRPHLTQAQKLLELAARSAR